MVDYQDRPGSLVPIDVAQDQIVYGSESPLRKMSNIGTIGTILQTHLNSQAFRKLSIKLFYETFTVIFWFL